MVVSHQLMSAGNGESNEETKSRLSLIETSMSSECRFPYPAVRFRGPLL